jgi:YbbR domain-containing protein
MNFRDLILHNFWWKLLSLTLAALTWSIIHFDTNFKDVQITPASESPTLELPAVEIGVRTRPDDTNTYIFWPRTAHMVLTAKEEVLEEIRDSAAGKVDAYLDLASVNLDEPRQIELRVWLPEGVRRVSVVPSHLMVRKDVPKKSENPTE